MVTNKKFFSLAVFIGLTVSLAFTVLMVSKRTVFKQKAAFGTVGLSLQPATGSYQKDQEFNLQLIINNPENWKIGAFTVSLSFDPQKLEIVSYAANVPFTLIDDQSNSPEKLGRTTGEATIEGISISSSAESEAIVAAILTVKGKEIGNYPLDIVKEQSILSGENPDPTSIDAEVAVGAVHNASLTITDGTGTPIPSPTITPGGSTLTPTLTPTPTPTPTGTISVTPSLTPTPTPTPGDINLNFKIRFQGVFVKREDQKVRVTADCRTTNFHRRDTYSGNVAANDSGVYSGSVVLTGQQLGYKCIFFIKGPKHLARRFCENNQKVRCTSPASGEAPKSIILAATNTLDFSQLVLEGGDLPNPNEDGRQDGVVNSVDYGLVRNRLSSTGAEDLAVADINLDGAVNVTDITLLRNTLETRYEEDN